MRQGILVLAVIVIAMAWPLGASSAYAAPSRAEVDLPCGVIPSPLGQLACNAVEDAGPIPNPVSIVGDAAGSVASAGADAVFSGLAAASTASMMDALEGMTKDLQTSSTPNMARTWFVDLYGWAWGLGIVLAFMLLAPRLAIAADEGDVKQFLTGPALLIAMLTIVGLVPLGVSLAVAGFDGPASTEVLKGVDSDFADWLKGVQANLINNNQHVDAVIAPFLLGLAGVIGWIIFQFQFLLREYALYLATLAEVIVLGLAMIGRAGWVWVWRVTLGLVGLITFRFLASVNLKIGVEVLMSKGQGGDPMLIGAGILLAMPFLTWAFFKFITKTDFQPMSKIRLVIDKTVGVLK